MLIRLSVAALEIPAREREILSYWKRCIPSGALGTASPALGNLGREVRNQTLREVGLHNRVRFDW
jgi:hypothetical protein